MIGDNNPVQYCEVSDEGINKYPRKSEIGISQAQVSRLEKSAIEHIRTNM